MQKFEIQSVDGTIHFTGEKLTRKSGLLRMPRRRRARMTVTVYVTDSGDGIVQEDVELDGLVATFTNRIHAGTSPEWLQPNEIPESTELLNRAWNNACAVEPSLRPVRESEMTENFVETRIPTGRNTHLHIRMQV